MEWYSDFRRESSIGIFSWRISCVPDDAEISQEVAEWDGALLPLLARKIEARRNERVAQNTPNNNPKETIQNCCTKGSCRGKMEEGGEENGWGVQSRAGRSFFGKSTVPFSVSFFLFSFSLQFYDLHIIFDSILL
jgi:hypothetical protein